MTTPKLMLTLFLVATFLYWIAVGIIVFLYIRPEQPKTTEFISQDKDTAGSAGGWSGVIHVSENPQPEATHYVSPHHMESKYQLWERIAN